MTQSFGYSLSDLDDFLPITNRNQMLKWLKERYLSAEDAMASGFDGAVVITKGDFTVTAEELKQYIDVKRGRIGKDGAQFLIRLLVSGVLPASLVIQGKEIDPEFYYFAFPEAFSFNGSPQSA